MKTNFKFLITAILIISILIIPAMIWLFSISNLVITTGTDLSKSDWLSFVGSFLGYVGTVTLGLVTLWQNHNLSQANERLVKLNTIAQFYSEIEPLFFELEQKKIDSPFGMLLLLSGSQKLINPKISLENEIDGMWHIRLLFKKVRPFAPTSFNIESCQIYLDNNDGETQKSVIGLCSSEDRDKYFRLANKTDNDIQDYVIISAGFVSEKNDEVWNFFKKAKKMNLNSKYKYINSFKIKTESFIRVTLEAPKNQNGYKRFKVVDYFIYENEYSA